MTNCKNCGAVLKGDKCEYCGTRYSLIDTDFKSPAIYPLTPPEDWLEISVMGEPLYYFTSGSEIFVPSGNGFKKISG